MSKNGTVNCVIDVEVLGDRVLVMRDRPMVKTEGGIVIPEAAQEKPLEGRVMGLGRGSHAFSVKVGDRVMFSAFSGMKITVGEDTDDFLVLREEELLGVRVSRA